MNIECRLDDLVNLIGKRLAIEKLEDALLLIKAEVERVVGNVIEIEVNPDRTDMLSTEGVARALRSFLGISPGLTKYPVKKSGKQVIVKQGLKKIREFISCGIVRGVETSDDLLKEYMHLQEALTATHGRSRKKASIGLYVLDAIEFPVFYTTKPPEKIRFTPLGHDVEMDAPSILREHDKGLTYGPIISGFKKWPLLVDSKGEILSLPPIINSDALGQIDDTTRNIFIEVTGTHLPTVDQALNIMITSLAERGGKIESVTTVYPGGTPYETPNLRPRTIMLETTEVVKITGLDLEDSTVAESLEKMGFGAKAKKKGMIQVLVPAYRTDVLHLVDVIEDVAIGYGFDKIEPTLPRTMTVGKLRADTRLVNKVRDLMVGLGYQEVLSFVMSSPEVLNTKMLRNRPLVTTGNPKSRDFSVLRNALLPILLSFASKNQHADYPQRVFEAGHIVVPDRSMETRTRQFPSLCGLVTSNTVNITELLTEVGFVMRNLGLEGDFKFVRTSDPTFIEGRAGEIHVRGKSVGCFGEVSPEVLSNFAMARPVVAFEVHLPFDAEW